VWYMLSCGIAWNEWIVLVERGVLSFEYTPDANYSSFGIKGKRARKGLYGHWKHSNEIEMPLILP